MMKIPQSQISIIARKLEATSCDHIACKIFNVFINEPKGNDFKGYPTSENF